MFSLLDLKSGFHQLPLDESSKEKTAFTTHTRKYQFRKMPLDICNVPATFQALICQIFQGLCFRYLIAYIDDILVYDSSFEIHLQHLQEVISRLRDAGLRPPTQVYVGGRPNRVLRPCPQYKRCNGQPRRSQTCSQVAHPNNNQRLLSS